MTDTAGPFDGTPWAEAQWARHAAAWAPSGVYGPPGASSSAGDLPLSVSALTVGLGAGQAWVRGFGFERTGAAVMQTVTANTHASFNRRDRIVLRRNLATHTLTPVLITGTPASPPAAPALTQSETGSWDLPMFSFLVPPSSGTSITGIVDERLFINAATGELMVYAMANRPIDGIGAGTAIRPLSRPTARFIYDGAKWVQDGVDASTFTGLPAGCYVFAQEGTAVPTTGVGAGGGFVIPLPMTFAVPPLETDMWPGDNAADLVAVIPVGSNHTPSSIFGAARTATATVEGLPVRVNYRAVGYST